MTICSTSSSPSVATTWTRVVGKRAITRSSALIAAAFTSRQRHSARCVAGHRYGKDTPLSRLSTLHPIAAVLTRKPTVRSLPGCASLRLVSGQQRLRQSGLYHVAQKGSGESLCGQPTVGGWCVGGLTGLWWLQRIERRVEEQPEREMLGRGRCDLLFRSRIVRDSVLFRLDEFVHLERAIRF